MDVWEKLKPWSEFPMNHSWKNINRGPSCTIMRHSAERGVSWKTSSQLKLKPSASFPRRSSYHGMVLNSQTHPRTERRDKCVGAEKLLADYESAGSQSLADAEQPGAAWQATATKYMQENSSKTVVRQYRRKAHEWLLCTEKGLQTSIGKGLMSYVVNDEKASNTHPRDWPVMTVSMDQGSDQWSAVMFLMFSKQSCVLVYRDPLHRLWNDTLNSIKASSLWPLVLIMTICMSTDTGPWGQSKWGQQCEEAARSYAREASIDCPIFAEMYTYIADEQGVSESAGSKAMVQKIFASFAELWKKRVGRIPTSRWFAFVKHFQDYRKEWHMKLVILMYIGLTLGMDVGGTNSHKVRVRLENAADGEKPSTGRDEKSVLTATTSSTLCPSFWRSPLTCIASSTTNCEALRLVGNGTRPGTAACSFSA
eukprot:6088965-Amphidinium_carterae.2